MPAWVLPAAMAAFSLGKSLFGGKDKNKNKFNVGNAITDEYNRLGPMWTNFMNQYGNQSRNAFSGAEDLYGETLGNFRDLYSSAGNSSARGGFSNIASTGGFDPNILSQLRGGYGQLLAPLSGDVTSRMRGRGVFEENLATGGYKQEDLDRALSEARSSVPAFYGGLKRQIENRRKVSGGYGPGFDESIREVGRESGMATARATREARLNIADLVRSGRMDMGSRMSGAENSLQNLLLSRSTAGLGGLSSIEQAMSGNRLSALSGLANIDQNEFSNRFNATQGMSGLYDSRSRQGMQFAEMQMRAAGMQGDQISRILALAQSNPSWWEKNGAQIMNAIVSAGSAWLNRPQGNTPTPSSGGWEV